jgi:hypothetical protein
MHFAQDKTFPTKILWAVSCRVDLFLEDCRKCIDREDVDSRIDDFDILQQQLKKIGIIIHHLDQFNHNRSHHMPRARSQTALQLEPLERATLLPGLSPRYVWLCSLTTVVY